MKITGSYTIDAPQDQVWAALNDIHVLARIVPGCERLEQTGENEYEGTVKIGIQTIKGAYSGRIRIEDIQPPNHYKLVASGRSANGVVDGAGTVDLTEQIAARANGAPAEQPAETAAPDPPAPAASPPLSPPPQPAQPSLERRTVVVPADEQLKPESVLRGMVEDMLKERPWLPWVVLAFLLGVLFGRSRRHS